MDSCNILQNFNLTLISAFALTTHTPLRPTYTIWTYTHTYPQGNMHAAIHIGVCGIPQREFFPAYYTCSRAAQLQHPCSASPRCFSLPLTVASAAAAVSDAFVFADYPGVKERERGRERNSSTAAMRRRSFSLLFEFPRARACATLPFCLYSALHALSLCARACTSQLNCAISRVPTGRHISEGRSSVI